MNVNDLKILDEHPIMWVWRTDDDRPASLQTGGKNGEEVTVGAVGGATATINWTKNAQPKVLILRGRPAGFDGPRAFGYGPINTHKAWRDERMVRAYLDLVVLPTEGLP